MKTHPPFFLIGCPRSGTTLLRRLLNSHPRLTVPPETHFIPVYYRAWGDPQTERDRRRLVARILQLYWVRRWRLRAGLDDFDGCRTFREIVERLFELRAAEDGAARWGEKTPAYSREIPTLTTLFPEAQFVHIIRDGRDVALSLEQVWFGRRHPYSAARYWRSHVETARRDGARLGPHRYLEIRYEDLLGDTEGTMRQVCAFLGEPYDARVLVPWRDPRWEPVGRVSQISATEVVSTNTGKWRTRMGKRGVEVFEAVAGDLLHDLGYEVVTPGRRIGLGERLGWLAVEWTNRLLQHAQRPRKGDWLRDELALHGSRFKARLLPAGQVESHSQP